ncbi:hypothetical protein [Bacillus sp. EB600]|uniref:hypothetical protein n=1 Tax=Bacillus sp. EB600 TaxID=2806345 RepID=UPI0028125493|nr:hypothetical protein [Bacillus sp. EB600]
MSGVRHLKMGIFTFCILRMPDTFIMQVMEVNNKWQLILLMEQEPYNVKYGLATLCIGGGQGIAIILENV